ncbi:MAG TPA: ATP synthase F1 subunit gamma [Kofleriaceae bacterium]|jgi:F-type H+-transporting ATPase subunit gamma
MPSLKAIRKRIVSVKNTRKITRAMKLVAAAKLRRAQDAIIAARPYSQALASVVSELAAATGQDAHPLFEERELRNAAVVVVTSDRGLAGAFNSNVIRAVERYAANELTSANEVSLRIIGKKGNQHFTRRNARISSYDPAPTGDSALAVARETANRVISDFKEGKVDRVYLAYNEFKNAGSQITRVMQILPVKPEEKAAQGVDYIYEPGKEELLSRLVPLFIQNQIFRANLESLASFFGAQMMAMENATKSAGEMIQRYTLQYNRARQASITKELLEIISGAEALKG